MPTVPRRNLVLFPILAFLLAGSVATAQVIPPAVQSLPDGAVMVVQVEQPTALLDLAEDLKLTQALTAAPEYQGFLRLADNVGAKFGTDWKGLVRKLVSGGVTYAIYPGDNYVLMVDAQDAATLAPVKEFVKSIASLASVTQGASNRVFYRDFPGASTWSLDGKQFFGSTGSRLMMTNRVETLKTLFDRSKSSVASSPQYMQARRAAGDGVAASVFVNMAALNQTPSVRKALSTAGSPMDILLDGALKESLRESKWAAIGLRIDGLNLLLHAAVDGKADPAGAGAFTLPEDAASGILPNLTVPRQLAAVSLWRDLAKFYAAKDTLFPEKTSAAILFENFMEIFFSGRDLAGEVFGRFHPEVRLVAARQAYDPALGTPQEQYPAAALVFRVNHAEEFGEVFEEAWQKAIGLSNFTRGQQALPGLIFDRASHGGVQFTYCYYSVRNEKDRAHLPSRFNIRPALARVGPYIILSTTDALAKDVIDAVNREDARVPAARSNAHTVLEISNGADIAALLDTNRNELIRQSVVGSGAKLKQAEAQLDLTMALLKRLDRVQLSLSAAAPGQQADLELRLK
jgi:hypothetical protein